MVGIVGDDRMASMRWFSIFVVCSMLYFSLLAWSRFVRPVPVWARVAATLGFWVSILMFAVFEVHS
jgi:hypothetical protein